MVRLFGARAGFPLALALLVAPARAEDEHRKGDDPLVDPELQRSWDSAVPRFFLAAQVDAGLVYARPRGFLGYGKPFFAWVGVDASPEAKLAGFGVYAGLRLELPHFELRVGPRYFWPFYRAYLSEEPSYDRLDLDTSGERATTLSYEAEGDVTVPLGPGDVLGRGSVSHVTGVPEGYDVFDENLRVIVRPPWVWRARAGYALRIGRHGQHSLGLVVDVLDAPKRDDSVTVRTGPIVRVVFSRHLELRGSFVVTVVSPDRIGLAGGDFSELGLRYRWADE